MKQVFFLALILFGTQASQVYASGQCGSVFDSPQVQELPTLEIDLAEFMQTQNYVSRGFQKAGTLQNNRAYNETFSHLTAVLNRMLDTYVEALLFAQRHALSGESQQVIMTFLEHNQAFFMSLLGNNRQVLIALLQLRGNVLAADQNSNAPRQPIGFLHHLDTSTSASSPMKSIGFLQETSSPDRAPAQAMESIGFIQSSKSTGEEVKPLATIGFIQSADQMKVESKKQEGADVGYRYELSIDPKFGYFELSKIAP